MKPKVQKLLTDHKIETNTDHRLQADYNNVFYYIKYYFDKILFSVVKVV